MKVKLITIISIFALLLLQIHAFGQDDCKRYHTKKCKFNQNDVFQYSGQSRSAEFIKGQTSQFRILAYGGYDYSFSLCYEKKLGQVKFRLLEDNAGQKVLFDNSEDGYSKAKVFTIETTKKLIVEIVAEGEAADDALSEQKKYCIGVLIEYMKTPGSGF